MALMSWGPLDENSWSLCTGRAVLEGEGGAEVLGEIVSPARRSSARPIPRGVLGVGGEVPLAVGGLPCGVLWILAEFLPVCP